MVAKSLENIEIENVTATQILASWYAALEDVRSTTKDFNGELPYRMEEWLASLDINGRPITELEICRILNIKRVWDREIYENARDWLNSMNQH